MAGRALTPRSLRPRRIIGIHPGSAGNACNLPAEVYGELAAALLEKTDCALIITGTAAEQSLVANWPPEILGSERTWISMGQINVRELAAVVSDMAVYVCSSTGPLHLASAAGTSTVSPFCPMPPLCATIWGNAGARARVVEPAACPQKTGAHTCCDFRGLISAESIVEAVLEMLPRPLNGGPKS